MQHRLLCYIDFLVQSSLPSSGTGQQKTPEQRDALEFASYIINTGSQQNGGSKAAASQAVTDKEKRLKNLRKVSYSSLVKYTQLHGSETETN